MSAQQDTANDHGKGQFPRVYSPGRQQRFYEGYDAINWHRDDLLEQLMAVECICLRDCYNEHCPNDQHKRVAKAARKRAEIEGLQDADPYGQHGEVP